MDIGGVGKWLSRRLPRKKRAAVRPSSPACGRRRGISSCGCPRLCGRQAEERSRRRAATEETPRKLHGIGGNGFRRVDAGGFGSRISVISAFIPEFKAWCVRWISALANHGDQGRDGMAAINTGSTVVAAGRPMSEVLGSHRPRITLWPLRSPPRDYITVGGRDKPDVKSRHGAG